MECPRCKQGRMQEHGTRNLTGEKIFTCNVCNHVLGNPVVEDSKKLDEPTD